MLTQGQQQQHIDRLYKQQQARLYELEVILGIHQSLDHILEVATLDHRELNARVQSLKSIAQSRINPEDNGERLEPIILGEWLKRRIK